MTFSCQLDPRPANAEGGAVGDDPKQYEWCTDSGLAAQIISAVDGKTAQVSVRRVKKVLEATISARCPRCEHDFIDTDRRRGLIDRLLPGLSRQFGSTEKSVEARLKCNCREDHPGRPDGRQGCGFYFGLKIDT